MKLNETVDEMNEAIDAAKNVEGYVEPFAFGITRNDMGSVDTTKVLQCNYLVTNVNENMGSAAVFKQALEQVIGAEPVASNIVHKSENEAVYNVDGVFLDNCLKTFKPILEESIGAKHLNVQVIRLLQAIKEQMEQEDPKQSNVAFGKGNYTYRITFIYKDAPVETVEAGYLKLYALSEGKVAIRSLNLDGLFGKLTNCAWLSTGEPVELDALRIRQMELKAVGQYPKVMYVDKFPLMLQHVVPADNTRILDSSKVRMGAQLASGTTVMPGASYINFNAGTEGPVMVEGRISSSAVVGAGSDIGGGASILGVLSGTDGNPITIGENCLLGANSVTGIPLGNACIVDAGTTVLANTPVFVDPTNYDKINLANEDNELSANVDSDGMEFYAKEFEGMNGLHFRFDVTQGRMIVMRSNRKVVLNKELH